MRSVLNLAARHLLAIIVFMATSNLVFSNTCLYGQAVSVYISTPSASQNFVYTSNINVACSANVTWDNTAPTTVLLQIYQWDPDTDEYDLTVLTESVTVGNDTSPYTATYNYKPTNPGMNGDYAKRIYYQVKFTAQNELGNGLDTKLVNFTVTGSP
jgi:hypothetical protein